MRKIRQLFDRLLARLDTILSERKPTEQMLFMVVAIGLPIFIAFDFLAPAAQSYQQNSQNELTRVERQLQHYRVGGSEDDAAAISAELAGLNDRIEHERLLEGYIQARLLELRHLHFTPREWAAHLEWISQEAQRNRVNLTRYENAIAKSQGGLVPVMAVKLKGEGRFDQVMGYLHLLEATTKLSVVDALVLTGGDRLEFEASLALWGIQ